VSPQLESIEMNRFWDNVEKTDTCWNYQGWLDRDGYGIYYDQPNKKQHRAHRFSAVLAGLDITGKVVCHRCDNRRCVKPEHLFVGTQQDNLKDMIYKKRHYHGRPRKKGIYKLTKDNEQEIITSTLPVKELAKKLKVHKTSIYRIRRMYSNQCVTMCPMSPAVNVKRVVITTPAQTK
jgi:hypothetical protein